VKSSTRDTVEGKMHQAKGAIKEVAGKMVNNRDLEVEGKVEKIDGKVQKKIGQIEKIADK